MGNNKEMTKHRLKKNVEMPRMLLGTLKKKEFKNLKRDSQNMV